VVVSVVFLAFRSWRGVASAITTGAGTIWTIGLMGYMDSSINIITLSLPTFLLAVGNAYSTHIVARHHDELRLDGDPVGAARRTIAQIGTPVLVTALTTVLGFGALLAYHIEAIRNLGIFAVFGISSLFLLALTLTPALLSLMPAPPPSPGDNDAWLERVSRASVGSPSTTERSVGAPRSSLFAWGAWRVSGTTY
jgi:predicted RND superfamily exporter protein